LAPSAKVILTLERSEGEGSQYFPVKLPQNIPNSNNRPKWAIIELFHRKSTAVLQPIPDNLSPILYKGEIP